ncbi:MAG TPA: type II toxin-antitoxin system VapC family toxin [Thermoplasmata archaeon]|nr:type II toxin-antitoxin system VapC family toxin [Thermoplasmata archaeon]
MKTFDSWAWVEYFRGSRTGQDVRRLLEGDEVLFTPSVCLAELKAKYLTEGHDPADRLRFIKSRTSIVDVDSAVTEDAADLKVRHRLHMVDAIVLASSKARGADLVTGDKHFRGIPGVSMLPD